MASKTVRSNCCIVVALTIRVPERRSVRYVLPQTNAPSIEPASQAFSMLEGDCVAAARQDGPELRGVWSKVLLRHRYARVLCTGSSYVPEQRVCGQRAERTRSTMVTLS